MGLFSLHRRNIMHNQGDQSVIRPRVPGVIDETDNQTEENGEVPLPPGTLENQNNEIELLKAKLDHLRELMIEKDQSLDKLKEDSNTYRAMLASMEDHSKILANERPPTPQFQERIPVLDRFVFPTDPGSHHSWGDPICWTVNHSAARSIAFPGQNP